MLEIVPGPHGETISQHEKQKIINAFSSCTDPTSIYYRINSHYNNALHFGTSKYEGNVNMFLKEIKNIVDSKYHKIQVMGGVHSDSYGHSSHLIGQYDNYNVFMPAIVTDNYVRFKVIQDHKNYKVLRSLDETHIFHFLMTPPTIIQLFNAYRPVFMYYTDEDISPYSRYKRLNIQYV